MLTCIDCGASYWWPHTVSERCLTCRQARVREQQRVYWQRRRSRKRNAWAAATNPESRARCKRCGIELRTQAERCGFCIHEDGAA